MVDGKPNGQSPSGASSAARDRESEAPPNASETTTNDSALEHAEDAARDAHHADYHHWRDTQLAAHDNDYANWRGEQARRYDEDYGSWRSETSSSFSKEFEGWRAGRGGQAGVPASAQPATSSGSTPSSSVVNPSEASVYGQSGASPSTDSDLADGHTSAASAGDKASSDG